MAKDSSLAEMFHGPFKAYIDCDHVEAEIDKFIGLEPEKMFSASEAQYSLFHPMFYFEHWPQRGGERFDPPPLPTPRSRPLNEPFRLRKGVLGAKMEDASPPAPSPSREGAPRQRPQDIGSDRVQSNNWRQREAEPKSDRYVPPHQRPGAEQKYRSNSREGGNGQSSYQRGQGQQQYQPRQNQRRQQNDAQPSTEYQQEAPAPVQQQFPTMNQEQLMMLHMMSLPQQGMPTMPLMAPPMFAAMKPTELGPDGLPIRHAPAKPQFQDPAIVGFTPGPMMPFPGAPFGLLPPGVIPAGMPPMPGLPYIPGMYPGMPMNPGQPPQ